VSSFSVRSVKFLVDGLATLFTFLPAAIGVGRLTSCVVVACVTVHGGACITSLYLKFVNEHSNEACFVKHSDLNMSEILSKINQQQADVVENFMQNYCTIID
jgi:hypothetical protein